MQDNKHFPENDCDCSDVKPMEVTWCLKHWLHMLHSSECCPPWIRNVRPLAILEVTADQCCNIWVHFSHCWFTVYASVTRVNAQKATAAVLGAGLVNNCVAVQNTKSLPVLASCTFVRFMIAASCRFSKNPPPQVTFVFWCTCTGVGGSGGSMFLPNVWKFCSEDGDNKFIRTDGKFHTADGNIDAAVRTLICHRRRVLCSSRWRVLIGVPTFALPFAVTLFLRE